MVTVCMALTGGQKMACACGAASKWGANWNSVGQLQKKFALPVFHSLFHPWYIHLCCWRQKYNFVSMHNISIKKMISSRSSNSAPRTWLAAGEAGTSYVDARRGKSLQLYSQSLSIVMCILLYFTSLYIFCSVCLSAVWRINVFIKHTDTAGVTASNRIRLLQNCTRALQLKTIKPAGQCVAVFSFP